jgi:hypothetical protein
VDDLAPNLEQEETETPVAADDPVAAEADMDDPPFDPVEDVAPNAPDDHGDGQTRTRPSDGDEA